MNHLFLVSILSFAISFSYAQTRKVLSFDQYWQISNSPKYTEFRCDCFVDDKEKLIGPFECIHIETGEIVKKYNFKNDILHGIISEYYIDGTIKLEAEYDNGLPINEWKEYDEFGRIKLHRTFDETSRVIKSYHQTETPYDKAVALNAGKKEEPPIYKTECIRLKIDQQKYDCTEKELTAYFANPPTPPTYKNDPNFAGKSIECLFQFRINNKGVVDEIKIIKSTGDEFLDQLVEAHVMNMLPFESAKQYGTPIHFWKDGQIIFNF